MCVQFVRGECWWGRPICTGVWGKGEMCVRFVREERGEGRGARSTFFLSPTCTSIRASSAFCGGPVRVSVSGTSAAGPPRDHYRSSAGPPRAPTCEKKSGTPSSTWRSFVRNTALRASAAPAAENNWGVRRGEHGARGFCGNGSKGSPLSSKTWKVSSDTACSGSEKLTTLYWRGPL